MKLHAAQSVSSQARRRSTGTNGGGWLDEDANRLYTDGLDRDQEAGHFQQVDEACKLLLGFIQPISVINREN
jgi:hypothetical protein